MDNIEFYWDDIFLELHNGETENFEELLIEKNNSLQEKSCDHNCEDCWCSCTKED